MAAVRPSRSDGAKRSGAPLTGRPAVLRHRAVRPRRRRSARTLGRAALSAEPSCEDASRPPRTATTVLGAQFWPGDAQLSADPRIVQKHD